MDFLAPTNVFEGVVQLNAVPSADNHAITKAYLEANSVVGIADDSANFAEVVTVNGKKQLRLKPLTITDVAVDTVATSISNWVSVHYTQGVEKQEGDIIILTGVPGRAQTWIHNGGAAGTDADFTEIEGQNVSDAEVRAAISASSGIDYNSATGELTADQAEIRGFFAAGSGLSYSGDNGTFSLTANTDGIAEGASNLYFTDARARGAVGVSGAGLSYSSSTGVFELTANTGDIAEGSNLYFTEQRARNAVSASGPGLQYNPGTGQFNLNLSTNEVVEGSNQYFTDERARNAITIKSVAGPDVQLLKKEPNGALTVQLNDIFAEFSAGPGLAWDNAGEFRLQASTDDIQETPASLNKWFTEQRARDAISADPIQDNMVSYNPGAGQILVSKADFRKQFAPISLTANTWATLNHNLKEKLVHVSCYNPSGDLIVLDVQLIDNNNLRVRSVTNVQDAQIVVSI